MPKRSIRVADCNTSVSLENEFWDVLKEMAALRRQSLPHLITEIDSCRMRGNLSSALRIAVLEFYQQRAKPHAAEELQTSIVPE